MKIEGKVIIRQGSQEESDETATLTQAQTILEIEQYLNNEIASKIYKKFRMGFRIHLQGELK